jgi:hypothetical protein
MSKNDQEIVQQYASENRLNELSPGIYRYDAAVTMGSPWRGSTAARPNFGPSAGACASEYWDTTLGKPIWWNGAGWVDATGASV